MNHLMNRNYACLFATWIAVGYCSAVAPILLAAENESVSTTEATDEEAMKNEPAELSVPPLDHVEYPSDRPSWLSQKPKLDGANHTWVVVTPSCDFREAADESVHELAKAAVGFYIEQLTGLSAETIEFPMKDEWIDRKLVTEHYLGELTEGDSPGYEAAMMLKFTPEVQSEIRRSAKNYEVRQRLGAVGLIVTGLLGMFMLGSGFLTGLTRHVQKRQATQQTASPA